MKIIKSIMFNLAILLSLISYPKVTLAKELPDTATYAYYNALPNEQKQNYNAVLDKVKNYDTDYAVLPNPITRSELEVLVYAIQFDHPELFWISSSYNFRTRKTDDMVVQMSFDYLFNKSDIPALKQNFDAVTEALLEDINSKSFKDDIAKEKYVYDLVCSLSTYNKANKNSTYQSAYSVLIGGESVCAGYSRAFQYLLNQEKIPAFFIPAYDPNDLSKRHAIVSVYVNGHFRLCDITTEDAFREDTGKTTYHLFNLTGKEYSELSDYVFEDIAARSVIIE